MRILPINCGIAAFSTLILSDISEALEPQSGEYLPNYLEASEGENTHGVANTPC